MIKIFPLNFHQSIEPGILKRDTFIKPEIGDPELKRIFNIAIFTLSLFHFLTNKFTTTTFLF